MLSEEEYEKRYESIVENAPHGLAIVSKKGKWLEVNDKLCKIIGYAKENLLKLTFQDVTHPDDLDKDLNLLNDLLGRKIDQYSIEKRYLKPDKSVVWVFLSVSAIFDEEDNVLYFISQIQDITNQKKNSLKEKSIFENGAIGLAICDKEGKWTKVNNYFCEILGYSKSELLSLNFQSVTHKDDLPKDLEILKRFLRGEITSFEWEKRYIHKKKYSIWVVLSVKIIKDIETDDPMFVCSVQNITELIKVQNNLKQTNEKLLKTVEELTHFNYFASHDLKESVRAIHNYSEMLREQDDENPFLKRIADRSLHLNELIDDLLIYSSVSSKKWKIERFLASQALDLILADFEDEIKKKKIQITYDFPEDLHVFVSKNIFYHILFNFISNSIKYSSSSVKIQIKTGKFRTLLKVEDDGEGIREEFHKKVFQTFFRLSTKLNGTGLGLSLCQKMVEKSGGKLGVRSKINNGSTFWCYI